MSMRGAKRRGNLGAKRLRGCHQPAIATLPQNCKSVCGAWSLGASVRPSRVRLRGTRRGSGSIPPHSTRCPKRGAIRPRATDKKEPRQVGGSLRALALAAPRRPRRPLSRIPPPAGFGRAAALRRRPRLVSPRARCAGWRRCGRPFGLLLVVGWSRCPSASPSGRCAPLVSAGANAPSFLVVPLCPRPFAASPLRCGGGALARVPPLSASAVAPALVARGLRLRGFAPSGGSVGRGGGAAA